METKVPKPKKQKFIAKTVSYLDDCSRRVHERVIVSGEAPAGLCRFIGIGLIKGKDGQARTHNFELPGASDYLEAFGMYDTHFGAILVKNGLEGQPAPQNTKFIMRIDSYIDDTLQQVSELVVVHGEAPKGFVRYQGIGDVEVQGVTKSREEFPLDAKTLEAAFELYPKVFAVVITEVHNRVKEWMVQFKKDQEAAERQQLREHRQNSGGKGGGLILPPGVRH